MGSAIIELQNLASERNVDINVLLRKAHMVAFKLDLLDFDAWINDELDGYTELNTLPQYRRIRANAQINVRGQNPIPIVCDDESFEQSLFLDRGIADPVTHLTSVLETSKSNYIGIPMPGWMSEMICAYADLPAMPCVWTYPITALEMIIQAVRKKVLDWALQLEKDGIRGEDMIFSEEEKKLAQSSPIIISGENATVITGNVTGSTVQTTSNYTTSNHNALLNALAELRSSIARELTDEAERQQAENMIDNAEAAATQNESTKAKKWMEVLKNFLSTVGAGITARMAGDLIIKLFSGQP